MEGGPRGEFLIEGLRRKANAECVQHTSTCVFDFRIY